MSIEPQVSREKETYSRVSPSLGMLGTFEWNLRTDALSVDQRGREIFGLAADTPLTAKDLRGRIHPDDSARVGTAVQAAIEEFSRIDVEYRIVTSAGQVRTIETVVHVSRGSDGEAERLFGVLHDITESRQFDPESSPDERRAHAALDVLDRAEPVDRDSADKFRTLFNCIDEGFCIIEVILDDQQRAVDYRILETNSSFEQQSGLYNAKGRTARELVPKLEPFWFERYGHVAITGESRRFVSSSEPMGRSFEVYAMRVGRPEQLMVAVHFRDITTHTRSKSALIESESRFRHLADHGPMMVWVTEPDGRCTYLSRSWYEFTGQTEETGLGFGRLDATHPDDRAEAEQTFRKANATQSAFRVEYRLRRYDGEYRWAIDAAAPRIGDAGEFLGYVGSVLDITDRKNAEEALRDSEAKFRVLTESLPQLVWTCLPDGRCDYLSSQWVAYTGISEAEQLGFLWLDRVIHPDDRDRTREHWFGAVAGHHPYDIEYRIRAGDGSYRWFQTRGAPLRDGQGRIERWFGTCTDIDDLKHAEEGLRKANRELEEFAYVASHDLQEPLRMVNISTQLLISRHCGENEQAKQFAGVIQRGVIRMEALIRDLLTFSRTIHADEMRTGTADLSAALADALSVLKERIDSSGAMIDYPAILPNVRGETAQMSQVFQNLLSNALKYQETGSRPEVRISAVSDSHNWTIAVRDNGIGFDAVHAERIFGLFKRLHKEEYTGTGLGLAICRRIVERHGGCIWAESTPGRGSTFYFSLPHSDAIGAGSEPGN